MRLQKFLADAGIASRRKCEQLIEEGRVTLNGAPAAIGAVYNDGDAVTVDGKRVEPGSHKVVYAFYKPKNVICTSSEKEDRVKVLDYFVDEPYRLYTVGRLDYDSEGLIFVTNDGDFAEKLMHPRYMKNKTYRVLCSGEVTEQDAARLASGILLEDGMTAPAEVTVKRSGKEKSELFLTIHEGKNRQVRRMLAATGHDTLRLCRVSIGNVKLRGLKPGEYRELTREEIEELTEAKE